MHVNSCITPLHIHYQDRLYRLSLNVHSTVAIAIALLSQELCEEAGNITLTVANKRVSHSTPISRLLELPVHAVVCRFPFLWLITSSQETCVSLQSQILKDLNVFYKGKKIEIEGNLDDLRRLRGKKVYGVGEKEELVEVVSTAKRYYWVVSTDCTIIQIKQFLAPKTGFEPYKQKLFLHKTLLSDACEVASLDRTETLHLVLPGEVYFFINHLHSPILKIHQTKHFSADFLREKVAKTLKIPFETVLVTYKNRQISAEKLMPSIALAGAVEAFIERDQVVYGRYRDAEVVCGLNDSCVRRLKENLGLEPDTES